MLQLTQSRALADFFEATVAAGAPAKTASNWMMGEVSRTLNALGIGIERAPLTPQRLAELIALVDRGTISGSMAKAVFERMIASGQSAADIVAAEGLSQIDDEAQLAGLVDEVLARNGDAVAQYRGGRTATFGFLVGQVMKAASGKANPKRVNDLLKKALDRVLY